MKSVLLLGSYGQTNLGDDLLMLNYLQLLKDKGFDNIYVNASTDEYIPQAIKNKFPGLTVLLTYQTGLADWWRILGQVDCIVYGGGTIYKELYGSTGRSKHSVTLRMMVFNLLARMRGAKVYHLNIGIGTIKTPLGRLIAKLGLRSAGLSIFRDQKSYSFAQDTLKLPAQTIHQSTDGLFLNRLWQKPWNTASLGIPDGKYKGIIGVNLLSDIPDWVERRAYLTSARKLVRSLIDQGYYVVLIPFQHSVNPNNDHAFMQQHIIPYIQDRPNWKLLGKVEVDEVGSVLSQCDALIGMRFHLLLLATAMHVPFVAITYDTKCVRFLDEADYPHYVPLETVTVSAVQSALETVLHGARAQQRLEQIAAKQYAEGDQCLQAIPF